jgi:hypothetical protein
MPDKGWSRAFEDPIPLTRGRQLVTLKEDAADYITRLPKAEHERAQWQAATEALIMAAEVSRAAAKCANGNAAGPDLTSPGEPFIPSSRYPRFPSSGLECKLGSLESVRELIRKQRKPYQLETPLWVALVFFLRLVSEMRNDPIGQLLGVGRKLVGLFSATTIKSEPGAMYNIHETQNWPRRSGLAWLGD